MLCGERSQGLWVKGKKRGVSIWGVSITQSASLSSWCRTRQDPELAPWLPCHLGSEYVPELSPSLPPSSCMCRPRHSFPHRVEVEGALHVAESLSEVLLWPNPSMLMQLVLPCKFPVTRARAAGNGQRQLPFAWYITAELRTNSFAKCLSKGHISPSQK